MQEPEDMEASASYQPYRLTQVLGPERHDYVRGMGLDPTPADIWGPFIDDEMDAMRENRQLCETVVN